MARDLSVDNQCVTIDDSSILERQEVIRLVETTASGTRRFAANALWLLAAELVSKVASFAFVVIVARGLGPLAYGYFNLAISLGGMFMVFGTLGLKVIVTTEIVRKREVISETFSNALVGRIGMGALALVAVAAISPFVVDDSTAVATIFIVAIALFMDDVTALIGAVFKAVERMRFHAIALVVNRVVSTALAIAVVVAGGEIITVSIVYVIGSAAAAGFAWISLKRTVPELAFRGVTREGVIRLLRAGAPLAVSAILNFAVFRLDSILLQLLRGPLAVAMYGVAFRFFDSLTFIAYSITSAALPRFAKESSNEPVRAFQLASSLIISAYLFMAVISPFTAEWVIVTIFSERYIAAAKAAPWLAAAVLFYGIVYLARLAAIAGDHRKEIPRIAAVTLAVNIATNFVLIPRYGFEGAAIATLATEVFEVILILVVLKRTLPGLRPTRITAVPFIAAAVTVGLLVAVGARDLTALLIGVPTYVIALGGAAFLLAREQSRRALSILIPRIAER